MEWPRIDIPPIDLTRWTLRALRTADDLRRGVDDTLRKVFPQPESPQTKPDRSRPDLW